MTLAFCPECEEPVNLGTRPYMGQQVICATCRTSLEIVNLRPLELDWSTSDLAPGTPKKNQGTAFCPVCEQRFKLDVRPQIGLQVGCPSCKADLEVVSLRPLELVLAEVAANLRKRQSMMAPCPECGQEIKLGSRPRMGQQVTCTECRTRLEVINLNPPEFDYSMIGRPVERKKKDKKRREPKWDE